MVLQSEKLFDLYKREEELKSLIEKNKKKIKICMNKLVTLNEERKEINEKLKLIKVGNVIDGVLDITTGVNPLDLITLPMEKKKVNDLKKEKKEIIAKMKILMKKKEELKNESIALKEELASVKEEIRSI